MNYYDLLGIAPQATLAQIREAYRRLAKQYHPDRFHRLSETAKKYVQEKMLLLNEAYRVLSDPDERQKYDEQNKRKVVSSQDYARYVDLDWKLYQLLGQEKFRRRTLNNANEKPTLSLPWFRALGFPLFFVEALVRQAGFTFDLINVFILLTIGTEYKRFAWRSKIPLGFWLSWGVLWGWVFFVSPSFPLASNSGLRYGIPLLLFLLSQVLFSRLYHLVEVERVNEQNALQEEINQILTELRTLEDEIFGSENRPSSQTRYN